MNAKTVVSPRLTSLSHGGGCGCKIAPNVLADLLAHCAPTAGFAQLMVGADTSDDAAVYRLNAEQAVIATTDFFMPVVDDPGDFGRIAATNALSDVYAMGGTPLLALAIVAMPIKVLPAEIIRSILQGGEQVCASANIPIAGGHSIDSVEPIYGLAVIGVAHPSHILRNSTARDGDRVILSKPLGVGVYSAALRQDRLTVPDYTALLHTTTLLNRAGAELPKISGVHAMTDVTGFGLLGHLLEMCRGSRLTAQLDTGQVPLLAKALAFAQSGCVTGASARNWKSYGSDVRLPADLGDSMRDLLCDPQTSGGLLISCAPRSVSAVLDALAQSGCQYAKEIGGLVAGEARIDVGA